MIPKEHPEETIFKEAIKVESAGERDRYVHQVCGDNANLLSQVEQLLKAHDQADDFLEKPALDADGLGEHRPMSAFGHIHCYFERVYSGVSELPRDFG